MARPTYADVPILFTLSATTTPSSTQVNAWLVLLFKDAFRTLGLTYTTATTAKIDTEEVYQVILSRCAFLVNMINQAQLSQTLVGTITPMIPNPVIELTKDDRDQIKGIFNTQQILACNIGGQYNDYNC